MENIFIVWPVHVLRLLQLLLVSAIILLFIGRLVMVSVYQQHTGDYFDIKLIFSYPKAEMKQALDKRRFRVVYIANLLVKVIWLCGSLLVFITVANQ